MKTRVLAMAIFLSLSLSACGGGSKTNSENYNTTIGQELADLKEAYDNGLVTLKEYERARKDIVRRYR